MAREGKRQQHPPSELKRMKLGQEEEIQFGYYSPSQHLGRLQDIVRITNDGLGSESIGRVYGYGAYGTLPLRGRAEFEVKIVKSHRSSFTIGLMKFKKKNASDCIAHHDLRRFWDMCMWSFSKQLESFCRRCTPRKTSSEQDSYRYGYVNLDNLCEGDHFGVSLSEDGVLEFTVNGESQGIAAENVYARDTDVYAFVDHWNIYGNYGGAATVITKAGGMIIKSLDHCSLLVTHTHTHIYMYTIVVT